MSDGAIRVLLIEDNPGDARLIREQLAEAGTTQFKMEWVSSLADSFTRLGEGKIDLILCDLGLPDSQGLETLVRLLPRASGIPIIVLTGLDDQTIGDKALHSGAQDYLLKGQVNNETLSRSIRYAIERKRAANILALSEERFKKVFDEGPVGMALSDKRYHFMQANPSFCQLLGYTEQELTKLSFKEITYPEDLDSSVENVRELEQGNLSVYKTEKRYIRKNKDIVWGALTLSTILDQEGKLLFFLVMIEDITGRKRNEDALRESEDKFKYVFENSIVGKSITLPSGGIQVNKALCEMLDYSPEELQNKRWQDITHPDDIELTQREMDSLLSGEKQDVHFTKRYLKKDGSVVWADVSSSLRRDGQGNPQYFMSTILDITERKHTEDALRESEERFHIIFEKANDGIGISNGNDEYIAVNQRFCDLLGYSREEFLKMRVPDIQAPETRRPGDVVKNELARHGTAVFEALDLHRSGQLIPVEISVGSMELPTGTLYVSVIRDITERKKAAEKLAASEAELRALFAAMQDVVLVIDRDGIYRKIAPVNPALLVIPPEELLGKSLSQIFPTAEAPRLLSVVREVLATGQLAQVEYQLQIGGHSNWFSANITAMSEELTVWVAHNITDRKNTEQSIKERLVDLETLYESGLALNQLSSPKEIAQKLIQLISSKLNWHHITIRLVHPENETMELLAFMVPNAHSAEELQAMEGRFKSMISKVGDGLCGWAVQNRQTVRTGDLTYEPRYVEIEPNINSGIYIPLKLAERVVGVISIESELPDAFTDSDERLISTMGNQAAVALENAELHEETLHRLEQLQALHSIDQAITGSFDQRLMLDILLTHTLSQLNADAAAIFLIQPHHGRILQYLTGKGFLTQLIGITSTKLGDDLAGEAVSKREMIHIREPKGWASNPLLSKLWSDENFKSMEAAPLISKGEVKGVIAVFHRKAFTPEPAWKNFLETLAEQAAIAIDTTQLFENLQRANMELAVAYEDTIEGWSQAMDLRDKETEGHTRRVTEMVIRMGKAMQFSDDEITRIRRGALLHDIGKLGVPDAILHKTETLSDEEWLIMKKHPEFAYDMLRPIAYLNLSLDIPYSHHEKWDGTGYPQGLKGQQIPLAARIFAIVDVWDALTSDRPYRKAWSKPDTLQYIREQSGIHFDPNVVEFFLQEFAHD